MSYSAEVLADNPLGYYRLNETTGLVMADSSGNARNGSYAAPAGSPPSLGVPGLLETDTDLAASFNGTNDSAFVSGAAWMNTATFTAEALIKPSSLTAPRVFIARHDPGAAHLIFGVQASGALQLSVWTGGSFTTHVTAAGAIAAGTKYHVTGTVGGGLLKMYLDGDEAYSAAAGSVAVYSTAHLKIGYEHSGVNWFAGVIDEVAYYGTALPAERVQAHYTASIPAPPPPPPPTPPAAEYRFKPRFQPRGRRH